jgi:hypothetical protein
MSTQTNPGEWLKLSVPYEWRGRKGLSDTFILPLVAHSDRRGVLATGQIVIRSLPTEHIATLSVYISSDASEPQTDEPVWMPPEELPRHRIGEGRAGGYATRDFTLADAFTAAGDIRRALQTDKQMYHLSPEYADDEARRDAEFLVHGLRALIFPKPHSVGAMLGRRR